MWASASPRKPAEFTTGMPNPEASRDGPAARNSTTCSTKVFWFSPSPPTRISTRPSVGPLVPRQPRGEPRQGKGQSQGQGQGRPAAGKPGQPNGQRGPRPDKPRKEANGNRIDPSRVPRGEDDEPNFNVAWIGPDGKPIRNTADVDGNRAPRREDHHHGRPGHGDRPGGAPRPHGQPGGPRGHSRQPQRPALFSAKGNRGNG